MLSAPWKTVIVVVLVAVVVGFLIPSDRPFLDSNLGELATNLTIVITGANSGLGYATVEHLARAGSSKVIVLACRNHTKCSEARDKAASLLPVGSSTQLVTATLDLSSRSSIEQFSGNLLDLLSIASRQKDDDDNTRLKQPDIDVLINNAGIFSRSLDQVYHDGIEEHIYVNYLGHVLLTHLLWPTLQRCGARVVWLASLATVFPINSLAGWYAGDQLWSDTSPMISGFLRYVRSKRANLMFAQKLHQVISTVPNTSNVSSVVSHPGFSRSEIWFNGGKCVPSWLSKWIFTNPTFSMSSTQGALTQIWAALDRKQVPSGSYVGPRWWLYGNPILLGSIKQPVVPLHQSPFFDEDLLWEKAMQVLGIQTFGHPAGEINESV